MRWYARVLAAAALIAAALGATGSAVAAPAKAIFAGGCFWCMEEAFEKVPGVSSVISGYTGGHAAKPTYQQVSAGGTGHFESVEVHYDPNKVTYAELLQNFWHNIDPFDPAGQFCDKGSQYRSAIFVADDQERQLAQATKADVRKRFGKQVTTQILPEQTFYPAEAYHQNFYKTHSAHYHFYKFGCGRVQRLEEIWGKPGA